MATDVREQRVQPGAEGGSYRDVVRLSVNLAPSVAAVLKDAAHQQGTSVTEALRRTIALWKIVSDERARGNRVMVVEGTGDSARYREIVLL